MHLERSPTRGDPIMLHLGGSVDQLPPAAAPLAAAQVSAAMGVPPAPAGRAGGGAAAAVAHRGAPLTWCNVPDQKPGDLVGTPQCHLCKDASIIQTRFLMRFQEYLVKTGAFL